MTGEHYDEVIESHYLETVDGLFFAVKGLVHPPDRFLAILRYAPDPAGERELAGVRYRRLYHFAEQEALLRERYPHYLAFDPICRATLQSVPRSHIRQVYDPRLRLQQLRSGAGRDPVAESCVAFTNLLVREAGAPPAAFGVSGSVLIGLHTPASDLDVTVYGAQAGWAVQRALHRLFSANTYPDLCRFDDAGEQGLYAERVADTHMAFEDFVAVERRKINQGQFCGRPYFIRFVLTPAENAEQYGDYVYEPAGRATVRARVTDASGSLFTPCRYLLSEVQFLSEPPAADLREIVSFRGRFCEQAAAGDLVQASGMIEAVRERGGRMWRRLLLGNTAEDVMILRGDA